MLTTQHKYCENNTQITKMVNTNDNMNNARQKALAKVIESISKTSAKTAVYTTMILGITAIFPSVQLPAPLATIASGLSIEVMGNLLDKVAFNDDISNKQIAFLVQEMLEKNSINQLLTKDEFWFGFSHIRKNQIKLSSQTNQILTILNRLESAENQSRTHDWIKDEILWLTETYPKGKNLITKTKSLDEFTLYQTARKLTKNRVYNEAALCWFELWERFANNNEYEDYLRLCISKVKRELQLEKAARALVAKAWSAFHAQDFDEAIEYLEKTIHLNPNNKDAQELLIECRKRKHGKVS